MTNKLLADVDYRANKTPYQTYKIQHGIETVQVLIPLGKANMFEVHLPKRELPSMTALLEFIHEFKGEVLKG